MALFDIFKKKKKEEKPKVEKVEKPKVEKAKVKKAGPVKPQIKALKKAKAPVKPKKVSGLAAKVLKEPQVTEKATDLVSKNQYVFKVWPRSNKTEIKGAVEDLYGVNVLKVRIIKVPAKQRRLGRIKGWKLGYKKAIVKIQEGQKIEVLPR